MIRGIGPVGTAILLGGLAMPSCAADADAGAIEGSLSLTSGFVTRGISLGSGGPALQAQATFHASDGWFAGLGAGNFGAPWSQAQTVQAHGQVGLLRRLSPDWSAQLAYTYYGYPLDAPLRRFEYDELGLTVGWRDLAFVSVSRWLGRRWTLDRHGLDTAAEAVLRQPLGATLDVTAGIGLRAVDSSFSQGYRYGHVGMAWRLGAVQTSVSYIATSRRAERWFGRRAEDRWAGSVTWRF